MSCKYIKDCPSASGWCTASTQHFENCVSFLITAYENEYRRRKKAEGYLDRIQDAVLGNDYVIVDPMGAAQAYEKVTEDILNRVGEYSPHSSRWSKRFLKAVEDFWEGNTE